MMTKEQEKAFKEVGDYYGKSNVSTHPYKNGDLGIKVYFPRFDRNLAILLDGGRRRPRYSINNTCKPRTSLLVFKEWEKNFFIKTRNEQRMFCGK